MKTIPNCWAGAFVALAVLMAGVTFSPAHASNCSPYPNTLTNGTTADANQVMANFNTIMGCANASLAHNGLNTDITQLGGLTVGLTNSQLATMLNGTIKGNVSGATATPSDLTAAQVETLIQTFLPFEFYTFVSGLTLNAQNLAAYVPTTNLIFTTAGSHCVFAAAATVSSTYTLKDNGTAIGTAVFGTSTCVATITASPTTVLAGHVLTLTGPTTGDVTLSDIGMTFGGTRN